MAVIIGKTSEYTTYTGFCEKRSDRLKWLNSPSKSIVATSCPKSKAKQMIQIDGMFHQDFKRCLRTVKPPLLSANFLT
jgi:hypothetical protein